MFHGEYEHSLDKKGRLILPAKIREAAKSHYVEKFYMTRGLDSCIFLFAEDEWRTQETKFKSFSFTHKATRHFNRLLFSGAVEVVPDGQGRVLIPKFLKDYAAIKKDVIIAGVSDRIEIWDRDAWFKFYNEAKEQFEETSEKLMDL